MNDLITIIVPIYNVEQYLHKCIDSILGQTYRNLEIYLVDDGSTDNCPEICDEYVKIDPRINVIHKQNGGLSDARNAGLDVCHGDYVAFVDSDDYISCVFIETLYRTIIEKNADMSVIRWGTSFWDGEQEPQLALTFEKCNYETIDADDALRLMLYQRIATGAPFKFCKRSVINDIRFPYGYLYEDAATTYKYFLKAKKVVLIDADLYAYRMRRDSIIRQKFTTKKLVAMDIFDQLVNDKDLVNIGMHEAAKCRAYSMLYSVFLQIDPEDITTQKIVWRKLSSVRKSVMFHCGKLLRSKNRYAAWISLLGMKISYLIGKRFGQQGSMN